MTQLDTAALYSWHKKLTQGHLTLLDTLLISNITTVDTKHVTHDCVQLIPDTHTKRENSDLWEIDNSCSV